MLVSIAEVLIEEHGAAMKVLLRNLVLEMFTCKLGTAVTTEDWDLSTLEMNDGQKTKLKKIRSAHCAKLRTGAGKLTEAFMAKVTCPEDSEKDSGGGFTYIPQRFHTAHNHTPTNKQLTTYTHKTTTHQKRQEHTTQQQRT